MIPTSLYIHIPFCRAICAYCDFPKLIYQKHWVEPYFSALKKEFLSFSPNFASFKTIYIGGGTPSSLSLTEWESLLSFFAPYLKKDGEWSLEINPESFSEEKAFIAKKYGVNRLSFGIQSSQDKYLKLLGRKHRFIDAKSAVKIAQNVGFSNISLDLMYALPKETPLDVEKDLHDFLSLKPQQISAYSLIIEEGTTFAYKNIKEAEEEEARLEYDLILSLLESHGFIRYEVSSFALPSFECKHNLVYWEDQPYIGIGLGAAGYVDGKHYKNTRSFSSYLNGVGREYEPSPTIQDAIETFFLTTLRLEKGFALEEFEKRFSFSFLSVFLEEVRKLETKKLLVVEYGRVHATREGIYLLDRILRTLFCSPFFDN